MGGELHYNLAGVERYTVAGTAKLAPGRHVITLDFNYDGGGMGKGGQATLTVDGQPVASEKLPRTIAYRMSFDETLDNGRCYRGYRQFWILPNVQPKKYVC